MYQKVPLLLSDAKTGSHRARWDCALTLTMYVVLCAFKDSSQVCFI